jgi:hypothetical protein
MRRPKSRYHSRLTVAEQAALAQEQYPALVEADKREKHERLTREVFRQIEQERQRQISKGYDADHDDAHASEDLIKRIAMDIGKQVVDHIEHAYPTMFEAVSENAKLSIRNSAYNAIMAAGEAFSQGLSEQMLAEHEHHRRTMRRLRKFGRCG